MHEPLTARGDLQQKLTARGDLLQKVFAQDPFEVNFVPPSFPLSLGNSRLYVFEDNEPVMRITERSPQFRHMPRTHRIKLYDKLLANGILDKSLYTKWPDRKLPAEYELPWAQNYPQYGMDQDIFEKPYNDTACSIVSETNDNDCEVFMTEKIWKPIIAQQFFIVHGNYLYLQKLKEMGFKTYNNYFEEVYDLDRDPNARINTIVDVCDRLRDAPWQDLYLQSQALRQYNFDNFFNEKKLSEQINKTLNLFLEFADSRQVSS